jgi:hypothetical protein
MYLRVTEAVEGAMAGAAFEHAEFLGRLDVVFANRFFDAYDDDLRGEEVHPAWRPLFENRNRPRTAPIQFGLAGMNAHINFDLPVSVVTTCREMALEPTQDTTQHRDYQKVNGILDQVDDVVKAEFAVGAAGAFDEAAGKVDDALEMWAITEARAVAWTVAETLWCLQEVAVPRGLFLATLARSVGLASKGILV